MTNRIIRKLKKFYKQSVVYWAPGTKTEFNYSSFSDPVEILGRWIDKPELVKDSNGEDVLCSSILYTDSDLTINGYVKLCDLDDIDSSITGPEDEELTDVRKIVSKSNTPIKSGGEFMREVWLR